MPPPFIHMVVGNCGPEHASCQNSQRHLQKHDCRHRVGDDLVASQKCTEDAPAYNFHKDNDRDQHQPCSSNIVQCRAYAMGSGRLPSSHSRKLRILYKIPCNYFSWNGEVNYLGSCRSQIPATTPRSYKLQVYSYHIHEARMSC